MDVSSNIKYILGFSINQSNGEMWPQNLGGKDAIFLKCRSRRKYAVKYLEGTQYNFCFVKDTVALQMSYFLKIKIFISLDSCQFVEY